MYRLRPADLAVSWMIRTAGVRSADALSMMSMLGTLITTTDAVVVIAVADGASADCSAVGATP